MICKKGINDMYKGWRIENELNKRIYQVWCSMLVRCYSENYHKRRPTYKDCYVCERWLRLSNFVEDVSKIPNYNLWLNNTNYQLDKDIKSDGKNKCYCLEQCIFVINTDNVKQAMKTREYLKGENHPCYGKKRKCASHNKPHSNESKTKISESNKGKHKGRTNCKKVVQYDLDGNLIKIWDCAKDISKELKINYDNLKYRLQGKCKTNEYEGFIWKYYED